MSGITNEPAGPASSTPDGLTQDGLARLKLAQALKRARLAIAWERGWPHLARLLMVVGLFLIVSWAGLWLGLPFAARMIGVSLFLLLLLGAAVPMLRYRWPSREEGLARLDRGSGIAHRPATALTDTLTTKDPIAQALWQAQRERTLASVKRIRAGTPRPRLLLHDPWAVRALVVVLLVATYFAAGDERLMRVASAFDWNGVLTPVTVRVDAWIKPPLYTAKPPIILSAANKEGAVPASGPIVVPAGSTLIIRSSGGNLDVITSGGVAEAAASEVAAGDAAPKGTTEKHYTIKADGTVHVRAPSGQPQWVFAATPDKPPVISMAKDPERQARGSLKLSYKIEDDYGVTEARAKVAARAPEAKPDAKTADAQAARPLFQPPEFPLVLPNARTRNGVGQTVKDLSEDPYAGADVTLTLTAKDEAGNEGTSEPFETRLPERLFTKPLARALIEQRRILALDGNRNGDVFTALDALAIAPELFSPELGQYLGLRAVTRQLEAARTDDALREVVASLWALAVTIEDGNISDVDKALRAAQDALKQALERGASDEEIKKLAEDLRKAMDNYMRQLAEQLRNNPQMAQRPLDQNTKVLRQQDLQNMIDRMERLSRQGDKEGARELLEQLQQMLENLQMAQPNQGGDNDMEQALNELGDMIRKQQQLRDKTFKQGQDSRRNRNKQGQQGDQDQSMSDLQQDQQALRDRLKQLQEQLAKRGMGQKGEKGQKGQKGQQGDPGDQGDQGDSGDGLDDADSAMGDAGSQLGDSNADGAVESQGKALDALKKGAQSLAEAMQQGDGDQPGDGPGQRAGRQQGAQQTDPLGRPMHPGRDIDDFSQKIPGEIDVQRVRRILEELRRRLGDQSRPQLELDYIERLLKDY
ncbi:TIGR02302 family protein [Bradyrhizobium oligotrophicum]|uniref:TIGR02302 family protein n=1 Tax=Bradyrhizobium oligotrophicum TaxID=44255 RepID=UPI003EB7B297